MRKIFTLFITFWIVGNISAQVVTVSPSFPKVTDEITLTFDVTQSSDGRSEGLLGLTDDVFLWSGAGDDTDAFIFGPEGQTDFNVPFTPGTMTSLGDDLWSITLTPKDYYSIPDEANVTRLGLLLKNGDGSAQTEDVFIEIFEEGGLNISILSPQTGTFYDVDEMVRVEAEASEVSDFSFTVNGISQGAPINGTSAFIDIMVNEPQLDIVVTADNGQTTAKDSIRLLQRPMSPTAELPANVMDGINYIDNNTIIFVLAAPDKNFAYLTGEFSDWQLTNDLLMNKTPDGQRFWVQLDGLTPNVEYAFQYWVYDNDENLVRTGDPYAEIILDPNNDRFISDDIYPNLKLYPDGAQEIVSLFETGQEDYVFQTTDFERPAPEDLVVYELLIRDFDEAGSFQSVIDRIDYIADLGVNAIELMPIMEFSGNISWGYNTIYHTAVDKSYGTRDKLKELIDVAHSRGMAVILDIVFNHADFASPLVKMYFDPDAGQFGRPSVNNPWCNPVATHPFSVFADFNHDSELLRQFIDRVNRYWIEEFKVDGFRYDLSKGFTQNFTTDVGAWNALDNSRVSNLVRMLEEVRTYDETAYLMLEHLGDDEEEVILANEGFLIWGIMHNEYKNNSIGFGNSSNISRTFHLNRSGDWQSPAVIAYMESHDEQRLTIENERFGNSSDTYDVRDFRTSLDRIKAASTMLYTIPGPKLLWQYGEVGYDFPINLCSDGVTEGDGDNCRTDPKPVRLDYLEDEDRLEVYKTMANVINLKTTYPIFRTDDVDISGGSNLFKEVILRADPFTDSPASTDEMSVYVFANFDVTERTVEANFPHTGSWYHYFSQGDELNVTDVNMSMDLRPGEFRIYTNVQLPVTERELNPFVRPAAPTLIGLTEVASEGIRIEWNDNTNVEEEYQILRSTDGGSTFEVVATVEADVVSFIDNTAINNQEYTYKVSAVNNSGAADSDSDVITSQNLVTSLQENQFAKLFEVYPNPTNQEIYLQSKNYNGEVIIQLTSVTGNQVISRKDNVIGNGNSSIIINVSDLISGMYLLQITTDTEVVSKRIIVNN